MSSTLSTAHPGIFHDAHLLLPFDDKMAVISAWSFVMHLNCATLTQKRSTDSFQKIGKMFCSSEKFYYLCPAIVANN